MLSRSSASMPLRQPKGCRGSIMLLKTGDVLVAPLNNNFVSFHCRFAVFVAVLAVDLSVCEQFFCELLRDEDFSFTVTYRDIMRFFFEYRSVQSPRRSGAYHAGPYNAANVSVDVVECKGRSFCARFRDFSVWNEACLNQSLEAVTDTKNQVFLFEMRSDCVSDPLFADYVCNELSASVWLVTGTKSACECYNLCLLDFFFVLGRSPPMAGQAATGSVLPHSIPTLRFGTASAAFRILNAWVFLRNNRTKQLLHRIF